MPTGLASKPRVLAEPARSYKDVPARNMFVGVSPSGSSRVSEDKIEVLRFVRLTMVFHNGRRWEAFFTDLTKEEKDREKMVNVEVKNTFNVFDRYDNNILEAEVVRIDENEVILKSNGSYYRLRCGDFLGTVLEKPLSSREVKDMKLVSAEKGT